MLENGKSQYISSLAWYHNGTKLTSNNRISIASNGTSLTILHMIGSDAGKYEVKINSINYDNLINLDFCDRNILPILEYSALYAPVTFLLQEYNLPNYNPEDVISDVILPAHQGTYQSIDISNILVINTNGVLRDADVTSVMHKDGVEISDMGTYNSTVSYDNITTQSVRITYNNTDDVAGHYVHHAYTYYWAIERTYCDAYYYFLGYRFPIFAFYQNIRSYGELLQHIILMSCFYEIYIIYILAASV